MKNDEELARLVAVLAVPARLSILRLLKGGALCVNAITNHLDITQSAVSQHLRIMAQAGLVVPERRGCYVHYRLNEQTLAEWRDAILSVLDVDSEQAKGGGHVLL